MSKISLICHSVFAIVTFLAMNSYAGPVCKSFFEESNYSLNDFQSKNFKKEIFINAEMTMPLLRENLNQIRTFNPSKDHIEFYSAQVPLVLTKLLVKGAETISYLAKSEEKNYGKSNKDILELKAKKILRKNLEDSYQTLLSEAVEKMRTQTVTYEWYMSFFLKAIIYTDVSARVMDPTHSNERVEVLNRKMDTLLGKSKVFFSDDIRETRIYSSLGKEFSSLSKDSYFARYLPENTVVPVLFIPRDFDIIEAEKLGLRFVSLVGSRKDTIEGKKFPLKFAGLQMEQNLKQINNFKNFTEPKSRWLRFNNKISNLVKGDAALEALYAYVLRDAGLQSELNIRLEKGYTVGYWKFGAHEASEYLKNHFVHEHSIVSTIASQNTVDALLKIFAKTEQEALATLYKN